MKRIPQSHPLHNFCAIVALMIVVAAQTCLAFDPNEWRNTQAVEVPAKGLVRVNVPAATLDAAQHGLEDLRIIDSTGSQVPYLAERLLPEPESTIRPTEFRSIIENGALHLIHKTGTSAPIIGVSLETPATRFMRAADVEGSNDGRTWIKLAGGDSLFQLPNGATKLRVSVPEGAWQFLRVTIDELGRHRCLSPERTCTRRAQPLLPKRSRSQSNRATKVPAQRESLSILAQRI